MPTTRRQYNRPAVEKHSVTTRAAGAAATVVVLWGSAFVAVGLALEDLSPGHLALARYLVAALVLLVLTSPKRASRPPVRDLLRFAFAGAVGISLYNLALNSGQESVSPGVASLIVNTVPIWTSLFSIALFGERLTARHWVGTLLAFSGVSILGLQQGGSSGFESGALLILGAALAQAIYFVSVKPLLARYRPVEVTAWTVWFGCLFLTPFLGGLGESLQRSSPTTLAALLFLGVGPAALAYLAWAHVLAELPAGTASNVLFLVPVVAMCLGWLVLEDVPSRTALAGGLLSAVGVILGRTAT